MNKIELNKNWSFKEKFPTISCYTTTWNCIKGNYPFIDAIKSFAWADEVVVCDGGSTDETKEKLLELQKEMPNLKIYDIPLSGVPGQDGELKGMSRAMCDSQFLIQFDSDEICLGEPKQWKRIVKNWIDNDKMLAIPVIEPIGSLTNVRLNDSHTPWKWRISPSLPEITHGIPKQDQKMIDGIKYSKGGSDGCNPIHIVSEDPIPFKLDKNSKTLLDLKNSKKFEEYKKVIIKMLNNNEPAILHIGHVNLKNKISLFLNSWVKWWANLYNKNPEMADPYFPGMKVSDVTEEMIETKIKEIIETTPSVEIKEIESCFQKNV